MQRSYPDIALEVPALLLPRPDIPLPFWSVVACDQYTSQPEYWEEARRLVGDRPSTLDLVLPEAHLGKAGRAQAIGAINRRMAQYLADGTLVEHPPGFMLVEREVGRSAPRRGLLVALDLERYDIREGARELIRSTEGTDPARLPTRMAVRRNAPLETPHILVLIDDPGQTVIEPLTECDLATAYDFDLMQGGGRVHGWWVNQEPLIGTIANRLAALRRGDPPMLYAMGDGNHSFAAARGVWDEIKTREAAGAEHPARHALVELVNIHDPALEFEPIHRLVEGVDPEALLQAMAGHCADQGFARQSFTSIEDWRRASRTPSKGQRIPYRTANELGLVTVDHPRFRLETATLHDFIDPFLARRTSDRQAKDTSTASKLDPSDTGARRSRRVETRNGTRVDYIHGEDILHSLSGEKGRIGFVLPAMDKHDLFESVVEHGATPRKTFSLGEAQEKRFYLECRRIRP